MKKFLNIFPASALLAAAVSCVGLDSVDYSAINGSIFPVTDEDADAIVVGAAYSPFRSKNYVGLYTSAHDGIHIFSDMASDIGTCRWTDSYWSSIININFNAEERQGPVIIYNNYIRDITRMTNVIRTLEDMDLEQERKDWYIAQTRCGRGWLVYILYDMFGAIQLPTEELLDNPSSTVPIPRATVQETADFIEKDLLAAIPHLETKYEYGSTDYGRFTQALAYTVLMKFYMHEGRWEDAENCGRTLTTFGFDLVDYYPDIFTLENEGNIETIWACNCSHGENMQMWLTHVLPRDYPVTNTEIERYNGYRITWEFMDTFQPGDERLDAIVTEYTSTDGIVYNRENPGSTNERLQLGAIPRKYGEDPEQIGEGSGIDWIVFRYADVLTLLAEAIARNAGAVTQEAVNYLNEVHTRAGLTAYKVSDFASLEDFLDAVLDERGWELWFEGCRRSDLIRHGKFVEYAKTRKHSTTVQEYMELFPLPQTVINEGKGVIAQNPGY